MMDKATHYRHAAIDDHALVARIEIIQAAHRARCHIADLCRFHTRSIGQVRRFEAAKLNKGETK
jgi:hypothetical protein